MYNVLQVYRISCLLVFCYVYLPLYLTIHSSTNLSFNSSIKNPFKPYHLGNTLKLIQDPSSPLSPPSPPPFLSGPLSYLPYPIILSTLKLVSPLFKIPRFSCLSFPFSFPPLSPFYIVFPSFSSFFPFSFPPLSHFLFI